MFSSFFALLYGYAIIVRLLAACESSRTVVEPVTMVAQGLPSPLYREPPLCEARSSDLPLAHMRVIHCTNGHAWVVCI